MKILVAYAVEAEFAPWHKLRDLHVIEHGDSPIHQAQVGRAAVDFIVSGMGYENAFRAAKTALERDYSVCIAAGFSGALRPEYRASDIVTADAVQRLGKSKTLQAQRRLASTAQSRGAKRSSMFLTVDHVVRTSEEKSRLAPFAGAVDMESFAVAAAADERGISALPIRVISDSFDQDLPVNIESMLDDRGRVKPYGVFSEVVRHPLQLPALIRLGRRSNTAAQALAHFLESYIKEISFYSHGSVPENLQDVAAR